MFERRLVFGTNGEMDLTIRSGMLDTFSWRQRLNTPWFKAWVETLENLPGSDGGGTVIDFGAEAGLLTLAAARLRPQARVLTLARESGLERVRRNLVYNGVTEDSVVCLPADNVPDIDSSELARVNLAVHGALVPDWILASGPETLFLTAVLTDRLNLQLWKAGYALSSYGSALKAGKDDYIYLKES